MPGEYKGPKKPYKPMTKKEAKEVKRGDRVSWTYQGKRTYGVITSIGGKRASIKALAVALSPVLVAKTIQLCGLSLNQPATQY